MALTRFAEINGTRVDVTDLETVTEFRCDACGLFVADIYAVHGSAMVQVGARGQFVVPFDAHQEHVAQALADAQRKVAELAWP